MGIDVLLYNALRKVRILISFDSSIAWKRWPFYLPIQLFLSWARLHFRIMTKIFCIQQLHWSVILCFAPSISSVSYHWQECPCSSDSFAAKASEFGHYTLNCRDVHTNYLSSWCSSFLPSILKRCCFCLLETVPSLIFSPLKNRAFHNDFSPRFVFYSTCPSVKAQIGDQATEMDVLESILIDNGVDCERRGEWRWVADVAPEILRSKFNSIHGICRKSCKSIFHSVCLWRREAISATLWIISAKSMRFSSGWRTKTLSFLRSGPCWTPG